MRAETLRWAGASYCQARRCRHRYESRCSQGKLLVQAQTLLSNRVILVWRCRPSASLKCGSASRLSHEGTAIACSRKARLTHSYFASRRSCQRNRKTTRCVLLISHRTLLELMFVTGGMFSPLILVPPLNSFQDPIPRPQRCYPSKRPKGCHLFLQILRILRR